MCADLTITETVLTQNEIIKLQAEIIDDLFTRLLQYVQLDELEGDFGAMKQAAAMTGRLGK